MSGLEVLKAARAAPWSRADLTAADSVDERVKGLDLGADDYMAKPFALSELEARVRAGAPWRGRRRHADAPRAARVRSGRPHRLSQRTDAGSLRARGRSARILLTRSGRLVSKEQLVDHLCEWGEEVSNNAIEVYVHRLRKKIEVGGIRIATVRGWATASRNSSRPWPRMADTTGLIAHEPAATAVATPFRRGPRTRDGTHRPTLADAAAEDQALADALPHLEETSAHPAPRSLFGEILDWMLAPLLLLWPMSIAVTYLVAKSIANGPFDRALEASAIVLSQQVREVNGRVTPASTVRAGDPARRRDRQHLLPGGRQARRIRGG
jgi:CheY-like chemotaxis protein